MPSPGASQNLQFLGTKMVQDTVGGSYTFGPFEDGEHLSALILEFQYTNVIPPQVQYFDPQVPAGPGQVVAGTVQASDFGVQLSLQVVTSPDVTAGNGPLFLIGRDYNAGISLPMNAANPALNRNEIPLDYTFSINEGRFLFMYYQTNLVGRWRAFCVSRRPRR